MNDDLYQALKKCIAGEVRFDEASRFLYSTDASIYEIKPIGVVIPRTHEDVFATMEVARDFKVPVLPRGGGTSLAGQTVGDAVVIDMSKHLNRVLAVNREERWAIVEPGVVQEQLNLHLRPMGFLFGPDTSTANRATIGGMMGNNSAGSHSILYGKTIDHVLSMDVVLASGEGRTFGQITRDEAHRRGGLEGRIAEIAETNREEIDRRYPKIMRRVSGYNLDEFVRGDRFNLAKMMVGSEGTLAAVHQAKVNIELRPPATALCVVHYKDMVECIRSSDFILPFEPSAIELVDDLIIDLARNSLELSRQLDFIDGHPAAILLVEFYGESSAALKAKIEAMEAVLKRERFGYAYVRSFDSAEQT
jgi:FAD/FMN-containing dehydrogenase